MPENTQPTSPQNKKHKSDMRYPMDMPFDLLVLSPVHQFPYEQENILLTQIRSHSLKAVDKTLNDLLKYAILPGKNNLRNCKSLSVEIISVFIRAFIENGMHSEQLRQLSNFCSEILYQNLTYDKLCEKLQQILSFFMLCLQTSGPLSGSHAAIRQACGYIARHYASRLMLQEVADYVHLNPSYFSSIFKKNCGITYKEYLNRIRIEKSRQLLVETNYDIIDIAIATGFEDQSYFTKIFRKIVGQTPKQYRANL